MKIKLLTLICFICNQSISFAQVAIPITIGESRIISSYILDEDRKLNIYLPSNYNHKDTNSYHVIYLLDGGLDEDFIHVAGIVQFLTFPWIAKLPPSIVVGIENIDRKRDFTFPSSEKIDQVDFPTSGKSAKFIQFLEEELKPFIEKEYATNSTSTIIGQSLGGLLATEILFNNSYLFDNYVIVSPSLWWDASYLLRAEVQPFRKSKRIYIAVGKEGEVMEGVARASYAKIKTKQDAYFTFFPTKSHGDVLHHAVYDAVEKLFSSENK